MPLASLIALSLALPAGLIALFYVFNLAGFADQAVRDEEEAARARVETLKKAVPVETISLATVKPRRNLQAPSRIQPTWH